MANRKLSLVGLACLIIGGAADWVISSVNLGEGLTWHIVIGVSSSFLFGIGLLLLIAGMLENFRSPLRGHGDETLSGEWTSNVRQQMRGTFWSATQASDSVPFFNVWLVLVIVLAALCVVASVYEQYGVAQLILGVAALALLLNGWFRNRLYRNAGIGRQA